MGGGGRSLAGFREILLVIILSVESGREWPTVFDRQPSERQSEWLPRGNSADRNLTDPNLVKPIDARRVAPDADDDLPEPQLAGTRPLCNCARIPIYEVSRWY